jgi:uncharacterized protein YutE (UPF0331/DUF86 family)
MAINGVVTNKVQTLRDTVLELRGLGNVTVARLRQDVFLKRGIERSLQICVEVVIDIAHRLVSIHGEPPCPSGSRALSVLEKLGIIESADTYKKMVQFRNLIVHRYETIDIDVLVDVLRNHLGDFDRFVAEVTREGA